MEPENVRLKTAHRPLVAELLVVFALSLGASAVYSVISLIAKIMAPMGLGGQTTKLNTSMAQAEWLDFTYQVLALAFGMAPVALALYLIWQTDKNPFKAIGFGLEQPSSWALRGLGLAAVIGIPGLAFYIAMRLVGLSSKVVPAELPDYWWAIPVLLLAAIKASLLEEILVIGYLFNRLTKMAISDRSQILISATLRGSYHLYQGFGGFIGNFAMGLVFGFAYKKWGRITPLILAHFILDAVSFVGYSLLSGILPLP